MRPGDGEIVVRQELDLKPQEKRDGSHYQHGPRDELQREAESGVSDFSRASKKLHEHVAMQLRSRCCALCCCTHIFRGVRNLSAQSVVDQYRLVRQQNKIDKRVSMDDDEQQR